MPTYKAHVGLTLKDGRRIAAGDMFDVVRLPKWVVDQDAAVRVDVPEDDDL